MIDILLGVRTLAALEDCQARLELLGYVYDADALRDDPGRRVFRKQSGGVRTHHLHLTVLGGAYWSRMLVFRDYLLANPLVAREYGELKAKLARAHRSDGRAYTRGKREFVARVELMARSEVGIHEP